MKIKLPQTFCLAACLLSSPVLLAADFNIKDFGAVPGGKIINTVAFEKAITACSAGGGGRVIVPDGVFLTGTIKLLNNVELHLESQAVILGSTDRVDYPLIAGERGLVVALGQHQVSLSGSGEINGNGRAFFKGDNAPDRPMLVMFKNCSRVRVTDVTLKSPAFWTFRLLFDDDVLVNGIHIYSHVNFNNDGIDIDSRNVVISNCLVDTDDDALCFKSDSATVCENVTVTNCVLASNCNLIKMGTACFGGFKNISISNCVLRKASESNFRFWNKNVPGVAEPVTGLAGIALEVVDGGVLDGVNISNISMTGVQTPVFIRLGNRRNNTGALRNVNISNIIAKTTSTIPSSITAIPGFYTENIVFKDFLIENSLGETGALTAQVPEQEKEYPENRMFGVTLPASGLFLRHVRNITVSNFQLTGLKPDTRPVIYADDATALDVKDLKISMATSLPVTVQFNQVINAVISDFRSGQPGNTFFDLKGMQSEHIVLRNNELTGYGHISRLESAVKKSAVRSDQ